MRYHCYFCGKSVTSELPNDSIIRAVLICPECIEAKRVIIPDDDPEAGTPGGGEVGGENGGVFAPFCPDSTDQDLQNPSIN